MKLLKVFKAIIFLYVFRSLYFANYDVSVSMSHYGNAVTRAYENGNMKKLEALKCKVYNPNDKNIKNISSEGFIYQMKDGKKVACDS